MEATRGNYWSATSNEPDFPKLAGDLAVDVAIIGGGIVGITTARVLKDLGKTVAVVEALRVGHQVTGQSTAKVTTQHKLIYHSLERKFGEARARLYAEAQQTALREIDDFIESHRIDCDYEKQPAYVYTCSQKFVRQIEKEARAAIKLGLPASVVRELDLPFRIRAALKFDDQAQFHPIKYIAGLARTIPGNGCYVFENSRVIDWQPTSITTDTGKVTACHVVMATHLPLGQVGWFYARAHPYAEPVIAAKVGSAPPGMYINVEQPTHSFRTHTRENGEVYGIAVGSRFKPGDTKSERRNFTEIEAWLENNFNAAPPACRWVNEDYSSIDHAPYVGWSSAPPDAYLVATGFGAWGISNGTAAGLMLANLAIGSENPWRELFDARRVKPIKGGPKFLGENLGVAGHLIGGYLSRKPKSIEELAPGEAAILKLSGKNIAAYREEDGRLHTVSAACSHMGCLLGWNEVDRSWDCPCHGSRFSYDGSLLHGPAVSPLKAGPQASKK
jgi:glycine/D-amino acid oxidase-like deaminating enzyme/nitrite reductase/ring-hydroxylating ferredoxin subunit